MYVQRNEIGSKPQPKQEFRMNSEIKQIEVGCIAEVKVGRNIIKAPVCEILPDGGYIVQSATTGKKFKVASLVRVVAGRKEIESQPEVPAVTHTPEENAIAELAAAPLHGPGIDYPAPCDESEEESDEATENPAPESAAPVKPVKKMSLMDAAVEVLKTSEQPLNTREIVKTATEKGYWIPTSCKTPEQTLYGSIFREIATKENPRIVKSEQRGKFQLA